MHVQQPDKPAKNKMDEYERSVNSAVKAWRAVTQTYVAIFTSLAEATAADSSSAQDERRGHAVFTKMASTAKDAMSVAQGFVLFEDLKGAEAAGAEVEARVTNGNEDIPKIAGDEESSSSQSEASNGEEKEQINATPNIDLLHKGHRSELGKKASHPGVERPSDRVRYDSKGRTTLQSRDAGVWKIDRLTRRRERRHAKRAAKVAREIKARINSHGIMEDASKPVIQQDHIGLNGATQTEPHSAATSTNNIVPKVEYEDTTEVVNARLKAKAEKKEAAKKEKKRKRISGDSLEAWEAEGTVEKPERKKAKAIEGVDVAGDPARKHKREDDEPNISEGRKKRKKANGRDNTA